MENFGISEVDAGVRTGIFIALATFLRPLGGVLGDKFSAVKLLMLDFILMIIGGIVLGLSSEIILFTVGCLLISMCAGIGNGLIFKLVPSYFGKEAGSANGIVSMMGGLGGFFPPLVISYVTKITGTSHFSFILLAIVGTIALITMVHIKKRETLTL